MKNLGPSWQSFIKAGKKNLKIYWDYFPLKVNWAKNKNLKKPFRKKLGKTS